MRTPDQTQNPEDPRNNETTSNSRWRSAAVTADQTLRSAVDRVRPTATRATQRLLAFVLSVWQRFAPVLERVFGPRARQLWQSVEPKERPTGGRHHRGPSRYQAVQGGVAMAAIGVVGVLIGSLSTPQQSATQNSAHSSVPVAEQAAVGQPAAETSPKAGEEPSLVDQVQAALNIPANAEGIDVSNHNGAVDWSQVAASGKKFAFVLASDGNDFTNSSFSEQYNGAKDAGLLTGAYHFARPTSSATEQADLLVNTMGGYQHDGKTLPPVLDLEVDPDSGGCYGLSSAGMHDWVKEFNDRVKQTTGKDPIIYASTSFWQNCMGDSDAFSNNPLWLASYGVDNPTVPGGWGAYSFWQYTSTGSVPGIDGPVDINRFQGSGEQLKQLAR